MAVDLSDPGKRAVAVGVRTLSCAAPETASTLIPKDLEGCVMRPCSRKCRICRRSVVAFVAVAAL
eukprot:8386197-Alexandrium_andersonii.AAC.1